MSDTAIQHTTQVPTQAMGMIHMAFEKAITDGSPAALEVAREILKQMEAQRDYDNRERFNASLLRIQQAMKPIVKRGKGEKPGARYAVIEDIDFELNPLIAQEGMNLSFEPGISQKPNTIVVTAVLAQGAYERRYPLEMPADGAGPKGGEVMTRTHATGSAMTYAKRYLKNFIFDLQFKQKDDDGNRAGGRQAGSLDERALIAHRDNITNASNMDELNRLYQAAQKDADAIGDTNATLRFAEAKRVRITALRKEGKA